MANQRMINAKAGPLSEQLTARGITTCHSLLLWAQALPYGRNTRREQYALVLTENRGTCSTKHALVKAVAIENNWDDVDLYIGFFFMDARVFPQLEPILEPANIDGLPEAHTFLVIDGAYVDVTGQSSPISEVYIVDEIEIQPEGIADLKTSMHKGYLQEWAEEEKINLPPDQLWALREACIKKLSEA